MASSATVNGAEATNGLTPAQQLMQKHKTDDGHSHNVTIEDTVDEDDIQHPPPSGLHTTNGTTPLSEKAAGKQPAASAPAQSKPAASAPLDTQSEELFPSLGAPKAKPAAAATWSKKPTSVASGVGINGTINGTNGPAPRSLAPGSAPSGAPPSMALPISLPGRHTERVSLAPSQVMPRGQLKKPVPEIVRDINKRSKADIKLSTGQNGYLNFDGTGPVEAVRQALKDVVREVGSKQTTKVPVPLSVRPHIIGKGGSTVQKLSQRTGARINIPRQDSISSQDDDDSATIDVTIEGDAVSAEMARREIEAIINERTSSVSLRLKDIPHEYYPFLAGPHGVHADALQEGRDLRVQIPHYYKRAGEPQQQPAYQQPATFRPQQHLPIQISGDRRAAQEVRDHLERRVQELQRQITMEQMAIEKGRHQLIVGEKATALHDFLAETGCAIIFPPDEEDSENIAVIGPSDRIQEAMDKVMDLATSMQMNSIDIARQHANNQAHARNVTRYLQRKKALAHLERAHNARIVAQSGSNAPTNWEVYSKDGKDAIRARTEIMNLISAHPPSRFAPVPVDPFFHDHIRQQASRHVRDQYGVHLIVPDELSGEPEVLLVYEGGAPADYELPRRQPSANEAQQFQQALQEAQRHILGLCSGADSIVSRDIDAPAKFHDKIRRHVNKRQDSLPPDQIPVQIRVGGPGAQQQRGTPSQVSMRGPQEAVEDLVQNLLAFIEQEEKDELERGYTLDFEFPQQYANQLIGKAGSNIKKLREEFDVDIQVNEGKVEIKGPEAKANACKKHIKDLEKKLADEATHRLKIAPQFHKDLIGSKGAQVNRLQDRYKVRINFPRSNNANGDDEGSVVDGEAPRRSNQAPDEVVVRGPRKGADEARDELLSLLQYVKDNSHSATISVAQSQIPSLIGSGGRELEALRLATGAQIDVPNSREVGESGRAEVKIKGTKKAVDEAKKRIEESAKTFDSTVTREVEVDKKHHRSIIGGGGEGIRKIVLAAGGPDDRSRINRMVRFPKAEDAEGNIIRVEGNSAIVDKIIAQIQDFASQRAGETTQSIEVAPEKHRLLIGRGGESRRKIESQFSINLDIPKQGTTGPAGSQVKITGQAANIEKAKNHIAELTKDQEATTLSIPTKYHHAVTDNGQLFRRLRSDHKVTVDHGGQRPPSKPSVPTPTRSAGAGSSMPLITDDPDSSSADSHSWETHALHSSNESGSIPWILSGPSSAEVEKAKARIEKALEEAQKQNTAGFLILPDPRQYRLVIGPGGSEINRIRKETGTKIQVPSKGREGGNGEAIEIFGSEEGVDRAREEILKAIRRE